MNEREQQLQSLPEHLQKIQWDLWDETGRPLPIEHWQAFSIIKVLKVSDNAEQYIDNFRKLFPDSELTDEDLITHYAIFIAGIKRLGEYMGIEDNDK